MTLADPISTDPRSTDPVSTDPSAGEPRAFRWTRDAYYQLFDQGMFDGRRVELIDGEIVEMPAQKNAHAWSITSTEWQLRPVAEPGNWVRTQMPLNLSQWSDPEPDLAVVEGDLASWKGKDHPTSALLVVEVSDKTLAFDRTLKQAIYAAAGIREYWIVNLVHQRLEVHRNPVPDPRNARASRYASVTPLAAGEFVSPLAFPAARVAIADLIA
jgi:Uma2 family endonuclease